MPEDRTFRRRLLGMLLLGVLARALFLVLDWQGDPLARVPLDDAQVYWDWSAAIAGGRLIGPTPFLSAPLYPYLLASLRALGAGLPTVLAFQLLLWSASAWLLGGIAARRLGRRGALLAVAVFLVLADPALATTRILNSSLQVFLFLWSWKRLLRAAEPGSGMGTAVGAGAVLGLTILAQPALLPALLLVPAWLGWKSRRARGSAARPAWACFGTGLLLVLPATAHNLAASGEWIPVSAQAGVTFRQGNAAGATGIYRPLPGISSGRAKQNLDAYRVATEATGRSGWRNTDHYFFVRGLHWWSSHPGEALALVARKLKLFFLESRYGDVDQPALAREAGLAPPAWLAGIPSGWILLPGLIGLLSLARRGRIGFPELLLGGLPLLVVAIFFYSPRYRLPALPVAALGVGAWAEGTWRARGPRRLLAGLLLPATILLSLSFALPLDGFRPAFQQKLGEAWQREGDWEAAAAAFRKAEELGDPNAASGLGQVLLRMGKEEEGLSALRRAVSAHPESSYARRSLGVALARAGRNAAAEKAFRAALDRDPRDWEAASGLGNVLLAENRIEEAERSYREALAIRPDFAPAWLNLGVLYSSSGRPERARAAWEEALRQAPELVQAHVELARLLATAADPSLRDPPSALRHAQTAITLAGRQPGLLDLLATTLAANGRNAAAVAAEEEALRSLGSNGDVPPEVLRDYTARLQRYRRDSSK